jgi:hypothetical protein
MTKMERIWAVVIVLFGAVGGAWAQEAAPPQAYSPFAEPKSTASTPPSKNSVTPPKEVCYFAVRDPVADQRVREALAAPLPSEGLEFTETPLEEVVNLLREESKIEIQLDTEELDNMGIDSSEPVNCSLRNVRLDVAIDLILRDIELGRYVHDGVLVITTREDVETRMVTAVYPVGDIMIRPDPPPQAGNWGGPFDQLVDVIERTVHPETWRENGGHGDLRPISPGVFVIYQTQKVHEDIALLLDTIRATKQLNSEHFVPFWEPKSIDQPQALGKGYGGGGIGGTTPTVDNSKQQPNSNDPSAR